MIQLPTAAPADTVLRGVRLPVSVEHWRDLYLHSLSAKLLALVTVVVLLYLLASFARGRVDATYLDVNRRHRARKWVRYGAVVLLVGAVLVLFAPEMRGLGTMVAVLVAGLAVALQDVVKSVVGWLYISGRSELQVGSRIEVKGVTGDVIDIGVLKSTVAEVGNLVHGPQTSGRIVTIPNYHFLVEDVALETGGNPYVWQEIPIVVTYESDWRRADVLLREIAWSHHALLAEEMERGFRAMGDRYAFRPGTLTPIVYAEIADHGVNLTMRFLTHSRRRRDSVDIVTRRILSAFDAEPNIDLAYPTHRVYRASEALPSDAGR